MKDSIPKAIPYVLVGYFGISLVYNFVYFYMLGIDMRKIPFSWIDYTMSVSFIGPQMLYYAFIFSCGIIVAILFRKDGCCSGKTAKYSRKMIVFISMMVIVIIISAVKNYMSHGLYGISIGYTFAPVFLFLIVTNNRIIKEYYVWLLIAFVVFIFASKAQNEAIKDYCDNTTHIDIGDNGSYILIRSFDKGYVLKNIDSNRMLYISDNSNKKIDVTAHNRDLCSLPRKVTPY